MSDPPKAHLQHTTIPRTFTPPPGGTMHVLKEAQALPVQGNSGSRNGVSPRGAKARRTPSHSRATAGPACEPICMHTEFNATFNWQTCVGATQISHLWHVTSPHTFTLPLSATMRAMKEAEALPVKRQLKQPRWSAESLRFAPRSRPMRPQQDLAGTAPRRKPWHALGPLARGAQTGETANATENVLQVCLELQSINEPFVNQALLLWADEQVLLARLVETHLARVLAGSKRVPATGAAL
mmetsp:Transcript_71415/g.180876  ORF Transcript_71415/g.180876 Transcript_71415/m.180876 type:complete len:240 (-) Transcript_71415:768-1487(-)